MSDDRVQDALAIFREACELQKGERAAFLADACGEDRELRAEIESMLAWDETGDDEAAPDPVRAVLAGLERPVEPATVPATIGGYRIVRLIAQGGMGVVYEATQEHPARRVAIKVSRTGGATSERARRFELEAQLLARLRHPGIAQIIEAGTTGPDDGAQPFFVMEFVEGRSLTDYAKAHLPATRAKLELVVRVCEPVGFAHGRGVIHRDLKPDNVLTDDGGAPKVLDFGVAKVEAAGGFGAATLRTEAGRVIGTLGYMAPEQLGGETEGLTAAADVYSLGVMTYELLTGRLPHELDGATLSRALAVVTSVDAPLLGVVRPEYRGDLEAVVAKALEKDPRDRYPDAAALATDIERYLRDEPVLARRHSAFHRMRKFSRRHRGLVGGVAATVAALLLGLIVALYFAVGEAEQRKIAERSIHEFDLLAVDVRCDNLIERVHGLDPAWPDKLPAIEEWLDECGELLAMRGDIEQTVKNLEARAQPLDAGPQVLLDTLKQLLPRLHRLEADVKPAVEQRETWAARIGELTRNNANARVSWAEARAAITEADGVVASELYAGQTIGLGDRDVLGLVPIGMNPVTKLWEFYHLRSAWDGEADPAAIAIPEHRPDGSLEATAETGIVFVLIPDGKFFMGAQKDDPDAPNYDPMAEIREGPVLEVELGPYFLSRYELTQGQWPRLNDGERTSIPALGGEGRGRFESDACPAAWITWTMCDELLRRYGLALPTEAQWERGCRAGTDTPWFTGETPDSLSGYARIRDDGFNDPAPVGSFLPNRFGLHDVHGNVHEWVDEGPSEYAKPTRPGDGRRTPGPFSTTRLARGGSCQESAKQVRSSCRDFSGPPGIQVYSLGVRPARALRVRD